MSTLERPPGWDEADSREFIDSGHIFVPDREEQIATMLELIPSPATASSSTSAAAPDR